MVYLIQSFLFLPTFKFKNQYTMSDIASRVKAIIVDKLGVDENEVVAEASFTNDLGADSLDTVELIMEFEKEFDIQKFKRITAELRASSSIDFAMLSVAVSESKRLLA